MAQFMGAMVASMFVIPRGPEAAFRIFQSVTNHFQVLGPFMQTLPRSLLLA